ncbi:MAG: SET domain-containing protein, partial [Planctomycetota bacterium]
MDRLIVKPCRHGSGVFAGRQIQRGEEILQFSGRLVDRGELPSPYCAIDDYYLQVGDDLFLGPSGDVDDFVNHSCDPNAGVVIAGGTTRLIAIRKIKSGEESEIARRASQARENRATSGAVTTNGRRRRCEEHTSADFRTRSSHHLLRQHAPRRHVAHGLCLKLDPLPELSLQLLHLLQDCLGTYL